MKNSKINIKRPKVTCAGLIKKGSKILLTKRNIPPYKNYWCLPGGHIEWGEKARNAVIREIKEELGIDFNPQFLGYFDEIIKSKKWHAIVLIFKGSFKGKINFDKKEVKEIKWFNKEEIKKTKLAFKNKELIKNFLKW